MGVWAILIQIWYVYRLSTTFRVFFKHLGTSFIIMFDQMLRKFLVGLPTIHLLYGCTTLQDNMSSLIELQGYAPVEMVWESQPNLQGWIRASLFTWETSSLPIDCRMLWTNCFLPLNPCHRCYRMTNFNLQITPMTLFHWQSSFHFIHKPKLLPPHSWSDHWKVNMQRL